MASIYPRKNKNGLKTFYVKFSENGITKRISTGKRNRTDAMEFWRTYKQGITDKRLLDLKTVALKHAQANCGGKMQFQYEGTFIKLIEILGNEQLKHIAYSDLQNYTGIREKSFKPDGSPYSKYTLNLEIAVIKKAFDIAHDKKWISENPARKLKKFKVKSQVPAFEPEQLESFLKEFKSSRKNPHYFYAVVIALNTGMRRGEVCNLKWQQVNFATRQIALKNKITGIPENAYFNDAVMEIFSTLKQSNILSSEGYIWGKPLYAPHLTRTFKKCKERLHLPEGLRFHSTRHTAITKWANTKNLHIAQDLARHSSTDMTKKYVHIREEQLRDAVNSAD